MRKLASVQIIDEILPIKKADSLECAVVGGWKVVVRKGEYQTGDEVIYCEVDSFIPHEVAPFLTKPGQEPKEYQGIKGQQLKTVKLRGQLSQGLILPLPEDMQCYMVGDDCTEALGIVKWERPLDTSLQGSARGNFPSFIHKTDQERCQNLKHDINSHAIKGTKFEVTEKLDGSSMTAYVYDGVFGVCSRNIDLSEDETNAYWKVARGFDLESKLKSLGGEYSFAIQGELIGPKIQGNPYKIDRHLFYVFDIFDITNQTYLTASERWRIVGELGLCHVPIIFGETEVVASVDELLKLSEGKSAINEKTEREGYVYKSIEDPNFSFKVISNKFLLK